jgi:hypothetical protein
MMGRLTIAWLACLGAANAHAQADPSLLGQWQSVAPLPFYSTGIHMLPSGKVLFYGGDSGANPGSDPRLWDPATATSSAASKPGYDLFCSGHAYLADGKLLIAGGHISGATGQPYASTYDAATDTWVRLPNMNAGRWYPTATTLANGDVVVLSGSIDTTLGTNPLPQVFQTASGTWRDLTSAQLTSDWYPWTHLAPNGRIFVSGPGATTRWLDTSGSGAWTLGPGRPGGARSYGSSVMYAPGKLLVMGGGDPPKNTAEVIDLNAPSPAWRAVGPMAIARRQIGATVLPDGRVLVTGGTYGAGFNNASTPAYAAEMWDPATESWSTMAAAQTPRLYHSTALLLPDGRVFTSGGNNYPQVELFSPPYLFKGARPTIAAAPATVGYGQSFFVETPDAAGIAKVSLIRLGSVTHAFDQNQRFNALTFSQAPGGLNVGPPADPNLAPPGHYMLFILNGSGVPSVARIVRLEGGGNQAPVVSAGADQTITLPANANLAGSASDDGPAELLTTTWSKLSGPGTVTFGDANALSTTASFSAAGSYALRLTASDGALTSADDVLVTVNAEPGAAGSGLTGEYYNSSGSTNRFATFVFTRTDPRVDFNWGTGSPGAGIGIDGFAVRWTGQVQAPVTGNYTFSTVSDDGVRLWVNGQLVIDNWTNHASTTNNSAPIALTAGTKYSIRMEFYEAGGAAVARLLWAYPGQTQTFIPQSQLFPAGASPNQPPTVNAGADQTITLPAGANLAGSASDDGAAGALTTTWSKLSGPGTVTFGNAGALSTTASFSASGSYTLRLTASDGTLSSSDDLIVTVNPAASQPPVVNAGADQTITLPASASLAGSASDDGPPELLATTWSKASGPGTVTFGDANALSTTASFSASGSYTLRLTANDGTLTSADDMVVTVNAAPGQAGSGLTGEYYNSFGSRVRFYSLVFTRIDPTVNFDWATGSPGPGVSAEAFAVRWTGQVEAPVTGNYTFSTVSDDGVRLWVNGQLVIDNWTLHKATTNNSAPVALVGGTKYSIRMEFFDAGGAAVARLLWAYPGQTQTFIPQLRLFP